MPKSVYSPLVEEKFVSSAVDTDLATGKAWARVAWPRMITKACLTGGAAANDAAVSVFVDNVKVMELHNYQIASIDDDRILPHYSPIIIPANSSVSVYVIDAFTSTATFLVLGFKDL